MKEVSRKQLILFGSLMAVFTVLYGWQYYYVDSYVRTLVQQVLSVQGSHLQTTVSWWLPVIGPICLLIVVQSVIVVWIASHLWELIPQKPVSQSILRSIFAAVTIGPAVGMAFESMYQFSRLF